MAKQLKTWEAPKLKMLDVDQTLSGHWDFVIENFYCLPTNDDWHPKGS